MPLPTEERNEWQLPCQKVVCVCTGITCYYSVVAGWTARYAVAALGGELASPRPGQFWLDFTT